MKEFNFQISTKIGTLRKDGEDLQKALYFEKIKSEVLGRQLAEATLELVTEKQKSKMLGIQLTQSIFDNSIEKSKTEIVGKQLTQLSLQLLEKGVL